MEKVAQIYFTSDSHGYCIPSDYQDKEVKPMGLYNFHKELCVDANTLILDGGDTIQGSPLIKYMLDNPSPYHPIVDAFNTVGYDYFTLGNHDFNNDYDYLQRFIDGVYAKCIVANVEDTTNQMDFSKYVIHTLDNGVKIGIVGIVTDHVHVWENPKHLEKFVLLDAFQEAQKQLEIIKPLCDLSICIYHGGFEVDLETKKVLSNTKENIGYKICKELDFNLLLTSHQHMPIDFLQVENTYVIQNLPNVKSYGHISIYKENNTFKIEGKLKFPTLHNDLVIPQPLKEIDEKLQQYLDTPIGEFSYPVVSNSKLESATKGSVLANFANKVQLDYTNADISCTSLSNDCISFDKFVTIRNMLSAYPFANTMVVLEVSKKDILLCLERCAEYFDVKDNEICLSDAFLKPKIEHYNYDFFEGITYVINASNDVGSRIESVLFQGKELEDKMYTMVVNNYRASGTGGFEFLKKCKVVKEYGCDFQELVIQYVSNHAYIDLKQTNNYTVIK